MKRILALAFACAGFAGPALADTNAALVAKLHFVHDFNQKISLRVPRQPR